MCFNTNISIKHRQVVVVSRMCQGGQSKGGRRSLLPRTRLQIPPKPHGNPCNALALTKATGMWEANGSESESESQSDSSVGEGKWASAVALWTNRLVLRAASAALVGMG